MQKIFRVNNFDLIRLLAALQVAITHAIPWLGIEYTNSVTFLILSFFPGVPIFFFVSGFLISKSYENKFSLGEYVKNRLLRIFPALIICIFISIIGVYLTGYVTSKGFSIGETMLWILSRIFFIQSYANKFEQQFTANSLNPSLWTIPIEIQFYALVPIIYYLLSLSKSSKKNLNLIIMIFVFMVFHIIRFNFDNQNLDNLFFKLFRISFAPWLWMFLVGVFFQKNFRMLHQLLSGKVLYCFPIYILTSYFLVVQLGWRIDNGINPISFVNLSILIFSFAYSFTTLSEKILNRNDISYGIYIYHMPIVNILIYCGYTAKIAFMIIAILISILLAVLSWIFIEKNSLKLKGHPLRTVQ